MKGLSLWHQTSIKLERRSVLQNELNGGRVLKLEVLHVLCLPHAGNGAVSDCWDVISCCLNFSAPDVEEFIYFFKVGFGTVGTIVDRCCL